jgi:hypothetical protein
VTLSTRTIALVCYGSITLAIAGVFGTWRTARRVSLDGVEGPHNGWIVIIFALIAVAGVRSLSRCGWLGIILVAGCAAVMILTAVEDLSSDDVLGGSPGWGIWLTIAASSALAGVAVYSGVERVRGSTRGEPTTSP